MENKTVKISNRGIRNMWTGAFMGAVVAGVLLVEASKSCSLDQSRLMLIWFKNVAVGTLVGAAFGVVVDRFVKNLAHKSQSLAQRPSVSSQDSVQA
jgi:high-affinity Fe2+/Pb2+ permease